MNVKLTSGISLLVIGVLFLFKQMNLLTQKVENAIFDYRNLFLVIGIILVISSKNKKWGWISLTIGVVLYLKDMLISWTQEFSNYLWPLLIILAGVVLILSNKFTKKK